MSPHTASSSSSSTKASQPSIKAFFQPRQPKYTPPPLQDRPVSPEPTPEAQLLAESASRASPPRQAPALPPATTANNTTTATTPSLLLPTAPSAASLPREATVRPLNPPDISALRRIYSLLLPVAYPDAFYSAALASPFSRVITWSDTGSAADAQVIGGIVCRLEPVPGSSPSSPQHVLYIQSLALLSPFRAHGLASAALADILALAALSRSLAITHVSAHVWTENDDGLRWYAARDFVRDALPIPGYYLKLRPNTAFLVRRDLSPLASQPHASMAASNSATPPSATAAAANLPPFSGPPKPSPPPPQQPAAAGLAQPPPPSRTPSAQSTRSQLPGQSFQNKRADMEWNDLPAVMLAPGSGTTSEASSRSSSTVRKKKERKYAPAAFGS